MCAAAGIRIGQRVAGWNIHEQERREHYLKPARLQRRNRLHHAFVRRRAAISRFAVNPADQMGIGAHHAIDRPVLRIGVLGIGFDAGFDRAMVRTQIATEPAGDE